MTPRRPRKRRGPRSLAVVAAALAAMAAVWLVLLPAVLRPRVETLLAASVGAPATVGSLAVGPRADLFLRAVRIGDPASGPTLEEIDVDPDARRVLRGDLVLNRFAARGLRAALGIGPYGDVEIRGLGPGSEASPPEGLDLREVVIREARIEIPASRDGLRLDVDRLVAHQVPDSRPGGAVAIGFLEGRLGGFPVRGEGLLETAPAGRRLRLCLSPDAVRFPGQATGLPDAEAARIARIADLLAAWPAAEIVLRHGCPTRPTGADAPGSGAGIDRRRMDSVRTALRSRGVEVGTIVEAAASERGVEGPPGVAQGTEVGCVRIEIRTDRSSLDDQAAS